MKRKLLYKKFIKISLIQDSTETDYSMFSIKSYEKDRAKNTVRDFVEEIYTRLYEDIKENKNDTSTDK